MSFIDRNQNKIVTALIVAGVVALIWIDEHREHTHIPVGKPAPTLALKMLNNDKTVTLASLKGQPIVLDFWATWCHPCMQSLPHINDLAKRYDGRAHFIAVNAESEDPALQLETQSHLGLTLPIASNGLEAASIYRVDRLPTMVILDRDGKVADSFTGGASNATIESALQKLL